MSATTTGRPAAAPVAILKGRPPRVVDTGRAAPLGWRAAAVLFLVALVDRVETNLVAGALPQLQAEFGFGDGWAGAIPTSAALAGLLLVLPAGFLADRVNRTNLIAGVVAIWSLVTIGTGLAPTFAILFMTRVALGAADQIDAPAAASLLADYHPVRGRSRAYGIQRAGFFLGLPLGVVLGGVLSEAFGWRWAFISMAIPGLLVAFLCWRLAEPVRGMMDRLDGTDPERAAATHEARGHGAIRIDELIAAFRASWAVPTVRGLCVGLPTVFLGLGGIFFWLPSYFERTHGLGESAAAGITAGAGGMGVLIGIGVGAALGDRRPSRRIRLGGISLLAGAGSFIVALLLDGLVGQAVMFNVATIFVAAAIPNLTAAYADAVPARRRGASFALLQFLLTLGGAMGPLLVGVTSDALGGLGMGFWALIVPLTIGSVITMRTAQHDVPPLPDDPVVVVTGSTRGIGLGLARELAARGARIVVTGRGADGVEAAVADLAATLDPDRVTGTTCDVTDPASVQALWDHAAATFGRVDVWINNAGSTTTPLPLPDVPGEQLARVIDTNVVGALHGCRVAADGMRMQDSGGFIYNVEGLGSKGEVQVGLATYGASKAAVGYLMEALRKDLKGSGVKVGAIRPGINVTEHLVTDAHVLDPERWARTEKIMNILGDLPETTTPWLADRILANDLDGARIAWLSTWKITWRFLRAPFAPSRDLFAQAGITPPHRDDSSDDNTTDDDRP
jgi:NAD(P)-dependent dehydrogenase (short-subunit alcohol dehydrogenase family)/predicted MFS family arabinose efflux permease